MNMNNAHYPDCEDQVENKPCICDKLREEAEAKEFDTREAEATGN